MKKQNIKSEDKTETIQKKKFKKNIKNSEQHSGSRPKRANAQKSTKEYITFSPCLFEDMCATLQYSTPLNAPPFFFFANKEQTLVPLLLFLLLLIPFSTLLALQYKKPTFLPSNTPHRNTKRWACCVPAFPYIPEPTYPRSG